MQRVRRGVDDENGGVGFQSVETAGSSPQSRSPPMPSPPSTPDGFSPNGGGSCILHTVSRLDTLAGVAIRYGVEVADIKRLNGLSSDLQMFALKTLRIPTPGKHPPSPSSGHNTPQWQSNDERILSKHNENDIFDSFQSLKSPSSLEGKESPAMSILQGYYGTRQSDKNSILEEFEMAVYPDGAANDLQNGSISSSSILLRPQPLSHHRKSRSVANSLVSAEGSLHDPLLSQDGDESSTGTGRWIEKLLRRRQKSASDFATYPPSEKLLKEESGGGSTISTFTGKGLALRPKSSSRTISVSVSEPLVPIPITLSDPYVADTADTVRKSTRGASLVDADNATFSSLWPNFQALSSAAIPIFDGLPKAIGKKSKTALD